MPWPTMLRECTSTFAQHQSQIVKVNNYLKESRAPIATSRGFVAELGKIPKLCMKCCANVHLHSRSIVGQGTRLMSMWQSQLLGAFMQSLGIFPSSAAKPREVGIGAHGSFK